nr:hypothetical protein [Roseococcus microcysteis]
MPDHPLLDLPDRAAWRAWLAENHGASGSVWLVIPRKGHGALTSEDAVLEALCFGWIDSRPRKLDATRSLLLMSPRRPGSAWSGVNKARVERLAAAGLMAAPGEAAIRRSMQDGGWTRLDAATALTEPEALLDALRDARRLGGLAGFSGLAPPGEPRMGGAGQAPRHAGRPHRRDRDAGGAG